MKNYLFLFFILIKLSLSNFFLLTDEEKGLRNWLKKLLISVPDIKRDIKIITTSIKVNITNLIINSINLDKIDSEYITEGESYIGVDLNLTNAGLHCNGDIRVKYLIDYNGNIDVSVSNLFVRFPLKLIKDQTTGLVSSVDTSGLRIQLKENDLNIKLSGGTISKIGDFFINILKNLFLEDIIKLVTGFISDMIDERLTELFGKANDLIVNGSMPIPLNVTTDKISDLRESSLIDTLSFLINNFTGVNGPLNFNKLINIISNETGKIYLHDFYKKTI